VTISAHDDAIAALLAAGRLRVDMTTGDVFAMPTNRGPIGSPTRRGYLRACVGPESLSVMVHRIVCIAVHGKPADPAAADVNHKNGIKTDNRPSNLEWSTPHENMRHAVRTGLRTPMRGEEHPRSRLTNAQASEIRSRRRAGESLRALAGHFGVSETTISRVARGRSHAPVGEPPERMALLDGLTGDARVDAAHNAAIDCERPSCSWCRPEKGEA
jgi:hypothetical protein